MENLESCEVLQIRIPSLESRAILIYVMKSEKCCIKHGSVRWYEQGENRNSTQVTYGKLDCHKTRKNEMNK